MDNDGFFVYSLYTVVDDTVIDHSNTLLLVINLNSAQHFVSVLLTCMYVCTWILHNIMSFNQWIKYAFDFGPTFSF